MSTTPGETPRGAHETRARKHSRILRSSKLHSGEKYDIDLVRASVLDKAEVERAIVRHPGSVIVLPVLDAADGAKVVFVRNYRVALDAPLIELPAGTRTRAEDPLACAARELEEETGYRALTLRPLATFCTAPGLTDELMHAFLASGLTPTAQRLEADEDISVHPLPAARALDMASNGELKDAKSMLTILLAARMGLLDATDHPGARFPRHD